jgi:DNA-binding transcriptional ArsR family regulator
MEECVLHGDLLDLETSRYHEWCMHSSVKQKLLDDARIPLLKELADPLRLKVVDRLGNGPASVSELANHFEVPLPQLSNHLKRLREAGLVKVTREGRSAIYELADPGLEALLPLLDSITGRVSAPPDDAGDDFAHARTCYGHLAGRLGVSIYAALLERGAIRARPDGIVELGPAATDTFGALGFDPSAVGPGRRRLAFECLDVTQHRPHLAGALGDAVTDSLEQRQWIERDDQGRVVHVTPRGRRGLRRALGI